MSRARSLSCVIAAMSLALSACGGDMPTTPTAAHIDVSGTWVLRNPQGVTDQRTVWMLSQSRTTVTGTSSRTASFVVSDTGTIEGTVSGTVLTFTWITITDYGGSGTCHIVTSTSTGALVVDGATMSGSVTSLTQPPCSSRVSIGQYTFTRE